MKNLFLILILFIGYSAFAQTYTPFTVSIEPITIDNAPGLHSFVWAKSSDGKWLIFGGRLEGLHRREPWAAFDAVNNNTMATVIDPATQDVWTKSLAELPASIYEQLQSTNQNFIQVGNKLITTGGYGYSATAEDHITYPDLVAIDVDEFVAAIVDNQSVIDFVRQVEDTTMAITGGQMGYKDGTYYLAGGQEFVGQYNPMGPNNGPGFYQKYSGQVRKFELDFTGVAPIITNLTPMTDTIVLPRRDYNMSPQIFTNGEYGFTIFSGVFKQPDNTPFFDLVNVTENDYEVVPSFTQLLSHYHSAKIPMYDSINNTMHTIFFGGMAQYYYDADGNLVDDENVPFVKTISRVTRLADGTYEEVKLDIEMPTLVGAGAEFIPVDNYFSEEILSFDELPEDSKTLVGYIYGGIRSTELNIFFTNDGTQSFASNTIFKVYIDNRVVGLQELKTNGLFDLTIVPNPSKGDFVRLDFTTAAAGDIQIELLSTNGQRISTLFAGAVQKGEYEKEIKLPNLSAGQYLIRMADGQYSQTKTLVVQ